MEGDYQNSLLQLLGKIKMFCKTEFHPAAFAVWEVGVRAGHCARGGPERRPGWRSRSVACRGAWRVGGERRVGEPDSRLGRGKVERGPAAAAACSGAAAARSVLCLFVGRRLPHTRCL